MYIQRAAFFISDNNQAAWKTAWVQANTTPQKCALNR